MLKDSQNILYFDQRKGHWLPGIIVKKVHDRSYQLVTQGGRQITRNRRQLKPHPGKVEVKFGRPNPPVKTFQTPVDVPKVPPSTRIKKPQEDQGNKSASTTSTSGTTNYITQSGRVIKKPVRFQD